MKKISSSIVALAIISSSFVFSQDYNKWSLGLNVGGHYGANPTTVSFKAGKISHYAIIGRYMINNRFGIALDLGYDSFKNKGINYDINTNYFRTSIQGVVNVGDVLMFHTWSKHVGLLIHAGAGSSYLLNHNDLRQTVPSAGFDDWMVNGIVGVTPQVKINERISLNMDVSYITHLAQNWDFDMHKQSNPKLFKNYIVNWSVGATFYLGKQNTHADWTPTIFGEDTRLTTYEQRIKELEKQLGDDDGDGVFNYKDDEPNTPADNKVDTRGVAVVEESVLTDSIVNLEPVTEMDVEDALNKALKQVNFEFASDKLTIGSQEKLVDWVEVLNESPNYTLLIEGHTDDVGSRAFNQILSEKRAAAVYNLLIFNGLKKERMIMTGYNFSRPKVPNTNAENRAINRRVELKFIKK